LGKRRHSRAAGHGLLRPVPFTRVEIDDCFWAPRISANRTETLAAVHRGLKETGRIGAFKLDWKPGQPNKPHIFWDSDVAKWLEAASYTLAAHPAGTLARQVDEVVTLVVRSQQPDGYINSHFSTVEPDKRWTNLRDNHELYCAGHLMEAAIAHFQATGQRRLLDALCRYADYIGSVFGTGAGQKRGYCGHPEIELALVRLYRATRKTDYLALARYFVDERGRKPNYFEFEARGRGEDPAGHFPLSYYLAHAPVREQREVTGHAVRAMYLYSAMVDLAGEACDAGLLETCLRLWKHATDRLLYVTGGIGSSRHNEGFTSDYDLPNDTAYAETCAAIGLVFWSHRMLALTGEGRFADVMERALYNAVASGVSLDGRRFFYENPLASDGRHHRQEWFGCACCPPNVARLLASLGGYIYSEGEREVAVHLYVAGSAKISASGQDIALRQETLYPWDGRVRITVESSRPARFAMRLRKPGWCVKPRVAVSGSRVAGRLGRGYLVIDRVWKPGDRIDLCFPTPARRVYANPLVRADCGRVALERGPIVYCVEGADNGAALESLSLARKARLSAMFEGDLLRGVVTVTCPAAKISALGWKDELYRNRPGRARKVTLKAVPYCVWDNREPGEMLVWIREDR